MPFVEVPSTLQCNVRFRLGGSAIENVLNFSYVGSSFPEATPVIWNILNEDWWPLIRAQCSDALSSIETYFVDLSDVAGPVATNPPFTNPTGQSPEPSTPNQAAFCVTHRTANRGRSYRGRTYISGLARTLLTGSVIGTAAGNALVNAFNVMRASAYAADLPFVIVSRISGGEERVEGLATVVTLSVARDFVVDNQRRRTPGRGQ